MNKKFFVRYLSLTLVILICGFIFYMSSKNAVASSNISSSFISSIVGLLDRDFTDLPLNEKLLVIESYQLLVRKTAHFTIYAALGASAFGFFGTFNRLKPIGYALICVVTVFLYAASDEIHQLFIAGRSGQFSDVLLDTAGGILGITVAFFLMSKLISRLEGKNENQINK